MNKKVYQKPIGITIRDMNEVIKLQKEWAETSGLAVKKTDVVRVLLLMAKTMPVEKIEAILRHPKEWYK